MFAQTFHFDLLSRARHAFFAPRKPRHRLVRVALGLVGLALLALLVMFGLFVGAAMIAGGIVYRLLRQRRKPVAGRQVRSRVLEGEYRVVDPVSLPR